MFSHLRASFALLLFLSLVTGALYPAVVTAVGHSFFPEKSDGSLVMKDGHVLGSEWIGQNFTTDLYFHPRPSAAGSGYDATNSSGSNLAPTAPDLVRTITQRVEELRVTNATDKIPVDLVTTSGSGLDPDLSVDSAFFQIKRVAAARQMDEHALRNLVMDLTTQRSFGILGQDHVNVLKLNLALDGIAPRASAP